VILLSFLVLLWSARPAPAPADEEPQLPPGLQLALLTKVLSFDRQAEFGGELVIAVPFQPSYPASVRNRDGWLQAARSAPPPPVGAARVRVVAVAYEADMAGAMRRHGADVAVLGPLRSVPVGEVAEGLRGAGIRTATGIPEYGTRTAAIQLLLREGRAHIVINQTLAQREGADFSSQLLRVAEVVR
jgi:hypothetical protein